MSPNISIGKNLEAKPAREEIQFTPEPTAQPPVEPEKKKQDEVQIEPGAPAISAPVAVQESGIKQVPTEEETSPAPLTVESISRETLNNSDASAMTEAINQVSESPE